MSDHVERLRVQSGADRERRVLLINRVGFLGGVERVIITLARGIKDHGYSPFLTCPPGELMERARSQGINVIPFSFNRMRISANPAVLAQYPLAWWRSAKHILRVASEQNISLIHVHHPVSAVYAGLAASKLKIPTILHVHDGLPARPLYSLALRHAVRHASRIVCVSQTARALVETVGIGPSKVEIIYNGIDPTFLDSRDAPAEEVTGPGPHIGVFGVVERRKGQHIFLEAATRVIQKYPTAHFWIVGPLALADKVEYLRELEALANDTSLRGHVTFTGFRADVARWMKAMDIVALTSVSHESFGMVLVEAMALGKLVVASNLDGPTEIIRDGVTGRVFEPGNPVSLSHAIEDLLKGDREQVAARAAQDVLTRFSPQLFAQRIACLYDSVLSI